MEDHHRINMSALRTFRNPLYERFLAAWELPHASLSDSAEDDLRILDDSSLQSVQVFLLLGIGNGRILSNLSANYPQSQILVVENEFEKFRRVLQTESMPFCLESRNVRFFIDYSLSDIQRRFSEFFDEYRSRSFNSRVIARKPDSEQTAIYFQNVLQTFQEARHLSQELAGDSIEDSIRGFKNIITNAKYLATLPSLANLDGIASGETCISVASGPSVDASWNFLKSSQNHAAFIACDSSMKPMLDHALKPHFVTALERDEIVTKMFQNQKINEDSILLGNALIDPPSWNAFEGRHIAFATPAYYFSILGLDFLTAIYPGSSSGNLNLVLAARLGFKRIFLVGHDLGFAKNSHQSHMAGTVDPARETPRSDDEVAKIATGGQVLANDGSEIYTLREYTIFKTQIENLIAAYPQTEFINVSKTGAQIRGAKTMSLEEATKLISSGTKANFDFAAQLRNPIASEISHRRSEIRSALQICEDELRQILSENRLPIPESRSAILLSELFLPKLHPLQRAYEALRLKIKTDREADLLKQKLETEQMAVFRRWLPELIEICSEAKRFVV